MTQPIPEGYHSVTPRLLFKDTARAIEFYKKAFGAEVTGLFPNPMGPGIMHAAVRIGNSLVMMADEMQGCQSAEKLGASPVSLFLYVDNADEVFKKALAAGASSVMPVEDMFWGDRAGNVEDPFGYSWMIATHTRDLTQDQMKKEAMAFFVEAAKNQAEGKGPKS